MPKASPIVLSFSSGELSRLFDGRVDLEEYGSGCREIRNFIPMQQGPATRRGGTRFVREVKDSSDRTGRLRFEFKTDQAYFLEVGDQYIRFYTDHGIVMNGTNPLELGTPWSAADLFDSEGNFLLEATQSGDVMYITHVNEEYSPQKLVRSGALSWSISTYVPTGGPFEDVDPDETITVYASAATGTVTLVASSLLWVSNDVGRLFLLEQRKDDETPAWEAGKSITDGDIRRVDGRNYEALNSATTGSIVPSHTVGAVYDGDAGVQWEFKNPGYGWVIITAVGSSGTTATATVLSPLPAGCVGSGEATTRWAFGAWGDANGWPSHVTFWRERLTFLRASTREGWLSVAGDFENFSSRDAGGEVVADSAVRFEIASDKLNAVRWVAPGDKLIIGTAGEEFAVSEITTSEPLGPGNVKCVKATGYGSRPVRPAVVGDSILFVQRSGRKLRDLGYSLESDGLRSSNLSVLAPHLLPRGKALIDIAYQQEPYSVAWGIRSDGLLLATTINANQKRFGWHRHPIGGTFGSGNAVVEAMEVLPHPDGDADELWMIVKRTINGSTKRYVEYMEPDWDDNDDIIEAFYVDSGLTYDGKVNATLTPGTGATVRDTADVTFNAGSSVFSSGDLGKQIWYRYYDEDDEEWKTARAEITARTSGTVVKCTILSPWPSLTAIAANGWRKSVMTISGLSHLEGQTVDVLADGASHPQCVVSSGSITLTRPATYVHVGLNAPCFIQTMRPEAGAADGTAQGKTKRSHKVGIRLLSTVGGSAGPDEDHLDDIPFRDASMAMDDGIPPFTGDKEIPWPDGYTKNGAMAYKNDQPLPATVVAFMPRLMTSD